MSERWRNYVRRLSPPGYDASVELGWLAMGGILALVFCLSVFFGNLHEGLEGLKVAEQYGLGGFPREMPLFADVLDNGLLGFLLVAVAALLLIPVHGAYWYQGSRSIYLMRRLPQKKELWLRTLALPLLAALAMAILAAVLVPLLWMAYCIATPAGKMPDGQWTAFWAAWMGGR